MHPVFLHTHKRLSTLNFDFSRNVKAILRQELNLFLCRKKTVGKSVKQLEWHKAFMYVQKTTKLYLSTRFGIIST